MTKINTKEIGGSVYDIYHCNGYYQINEDGNFYCTCDNWYEVNVELYAIRYRKF